VRKNYTQVSPMATFRTRRGSPYGTLHRMIPERVARCVLIAAIVYGSVPSLAAQFTNRKREALVACPTIQTQPLTPYGFARATLESLWYARNAVKDATAEIKQAQSETENPLASLTAMMRSTKISTNHFICAKRSVQRFASTQAQLRSVTPSQRENIRTAAGFDLVVYDAHIAINDRVLALLKKTSGNINLVELSDQLSTLEVERGQRWADLVTSTAMALMLLVDLRPTDENGNFLQTTDPNAGQTRRIIVTKQQKQELLDWVNEHFTEFKDGTPENQLSDPAKTAKLYLTFFNGHMCSDE